MVTEPAGKTHQPTNKSAYMGLWNSDSAVFCFLPEFLTVPNMCSSACLRCYTCVFPAICPLDCFMFPQECPTGQRCLSSTATGRQGETQICVSGGWGEGSFLIVKAKMATTWQTEPRCTVHCPGPYWRNLHHSRDFISISAAVVQQTAPYVLVLLFLTCVLLQLSCPKTDTPTCLVLKKNNKTNHKFLLGWL